MSNFHPDTRGEGGHLFRLTCSVVLWGGRNRNCRQPLACVGGARGAWAHWVCLAHGTCFPGLRCSGSRLLHRGLSAAGRVACPPGLGRSGSGPRGLRKGAAMAGPAFVPFQGPGSSGTRCVARALPRWGSASYHLPVPAARFPRCTAGVPSQGCPVSPPGS